MDLRRWQSIDRKLPLLASGLVLLTAVILGWTAYVRLERALLQSAASRLFNSAQTAAQMVSRPSARQLDSAARATNAAVRAFAHGRLSGDSLTALLAMGTSRVDTSRFYAAFIDTAGRTRVAYHRPPTREPRWVHDAIAAREIRGDTVNYGPFENVAGAPVIQVARAVRAADSAQSPVIGYVVDARTLTSGAGARAFRGILGEHVSILIGQPGLGVWTDLADVAPAPPVQSARDSIVIGREYVGAFARVPGSHWMVWLQQPSYTVLAPARRLWWSMIPMGIIIALIAAGAMWRITHGIASRIARLTEQAEGVAKDAKVMPTTAEMPIEVTNADEVTRLRFAFDRMRARVAERETLELQLRHSQKMEAVGRLAGGIAHDFNNLLTAIRSYADLMAEDMPEWDAKRADVEEIRKAAQRATALTAQLLAFSRKQVLQPKVLDTAAVLRDVHAMLNRLLIEDIKLTVDTPVGVWPVKADRGQLEQVIVNLAVNARDAMPQGGYLRISTRNVEVTEPIETRHGPIPRGEYVSVSVMDTGMGMDAETQSQAFEPFFTTKALGQGTGLGLATVHGIVAQSGGYVTVESAVRHGSTFTVYLPRARDLPEPPSGAKVMQDDAAGKSETVLLVEDEAQVRALAKRVLARAGYSVLEAATPSAALEVARTHRASIRLVVSDVVMPEMSGPQLVKQLMLICPRAQVLYISGYNEDEVLGRGLESGAPGMQLLQKPFSAQQLVERVRATLEVSA